MHKKKKLEPIYDNVIIEYITPKNIASTNIVVLKNYLKQYSNGKIISVNREFYSNGLIQKAQVKIGDEVIFDKTKGVEININNKNLIIIREKDLFCIIHNSESSLDKEQ